MKWFVYIVECADGTYYTGWTMDVDYRVRCHNGTGPHDGAKYTRSRRPVTLVHSEELGSHRAALRRERAIKKMTHEQKRRLIAGEE